MQWARHSIRVNTVAPGFFLSEITAPLYESEQAAEYLRRNTPLPREGTDDDIVGAVLWLAGDAGRYVTGQTVVVDGGWTARCPLARHLRPARASDRKLPADRTGDAQRRAAEFSPAGPCRTE